ncbi:unnamed protein product [Heligmosomoides polygyrus]|uniref:HTH_48 domain-containing protein n=1 Tax=Heligmosomoides polygyrus TaxID=6339 RepID=A0A183GPE6_HELPZ|nr:unnamed protein product [Heligmosomoides polygyrus]
METKMLRWTAGVTRMDRIRNDAIRQKFGVVPIADKMREARLRWHGHVLRGKEDSVRKIGLELEVSGKRPRGRPKQRKTRVLLVTEGVIIGILSLLERHFSLKNSTGQSKDAIDVHIEICLISLAVLRQLCNNRLAMCALSPMSSHPSFSRRRDTVPVQIEPSEAVQSDEKV